jgi:hypothetical protein
MKSSGTLDSQDLLALKSRQQEKAIQQFSGQHRVYPRTFSEAADILRDLNPTFEAYTAQNPGRAVLFPRYPFTYKI